MTADKLDWRALRGMAIFDKTEDSWWHYTEEGDDDDAAMWPSVERPFYRCWQKQDQGKLYTSRKWHAESVASIESEIKEGNYFLLGRAAPLLVKTNRQVKTPAVDHGAAGRRAPLRTEAVLTDEENEVPGPDCTMDIEKSYKDVNTPKTMDGVEPTWDINMDSDSEELAASRVSPKFEGEKYGMLSPQCIRELKEDPTPRGAFGLYVTGNMKKVFMCETELYKQQTDRIALDEALKKSEAFKVPTSPDLHIKS